jgi:carboxyl-terminal processing protease
VTRFRWAAAAALAAAVFSAGPSFSTSAAAAASGSQSADSPIVAVFDEVWQTINDSYYDPAFGGLDWPGVRAELRPKAAAANSMDEGRRIITDMLTRLKQSHFALLSASSAANDGAVVFGDAIVAIDTRILNGQAVITRVEAGSRAEAGGLKPGQIITEIDGRKFPVPSPSADESGSKAAFTAWRRVNAALHGREGGHAEIKVQTPSNETLALSVERTAARGQRVQFGNLPAMFVTVDRREVQTPAARSVGVIGFNIWMAQVDAQVESAVDAFRKKDGLIIDLRGNPGGLAAMIRGIAGQLINREDLMGTMRTRQNQTPGLVFNVNPRRAMPDGRAVVPFAGPVAILVDEMTASASECFAGALQDLGRARVFGRQTMGQALPASTKRLSNGDILEYVVGDFVTIKGRRLEGQGVIPDEIQPLSIASLAARRDDPLQAALAWIDRVR